MGPPSYVPCVIGRNVVVRRMTVYEVYASLPWLCDNERVNIILQAYGTTVVRAVCHWPKRCCVAHDCI